jgi:hypothetical protein
VKAATKHFSVAALRDSHRSFGYKGTNRTVMMAISTFLHLAAPLKEPESYKSERIQQALAAGVRLHDVPFLTMRWRNNTRSDDVLHVTGHEGRHRALALQALGYTHMPVVLDVPFRWSEQGKVGGFDYSSRWPSKIIPEGRPRAKPVVWNIKREDAGRWYAARVNPKRTR